MSAVWVLHGPTCTYQTVFSITDLVTLRSWNCDKLHTIVVDWEVWCLILNFTISTCRNVTSNNVLSVLLATILIQLGTWCTCANFTLGSAGLNRVHLVNRFDYSLHRIHNFQLKSVQSLCFHSQFTLVRILLCTQPQIIVCMLCMWQTDRI